MWEQNDVGMEKNNNILYHFRSLRKKKLTEGNKTVKSYGTSNEKEQEVVSYILFYLSTA